MRIKHRPEDFRVHELLAEGYLKRSGRHCVYRVKKRKRTSLEAAAVLAEMVGVPVAEVGIAGLKDRQGVTTQYMSVPVKRLVHLSEDTLVIEPEGFADEPLESRHSEGNAFEIRLRGISPREFEGLRTELDAVRAHGVFNYFGEQRFGNLRFGQGWVARELALGRPEKALEQLLCSPSDQDDDRHARFKKAWRKCWGDWRACRDIAGSFGAHHSVFEHLARNEGDFAGAFRFVSSRLRLIHLYAWQSHLWNRAIANWMRAATTRKDAFFVESVEGRLFFPRGAPPVDPTMQNTWRLPGPRLADVVHPRQRELFVEVLALEGLKPEQYSIEGISGFQLKGEDRELLIHPRQMRAHDEGADEQGYSRVQLAFELPRGAYATMLIARLFPDLHAEPEQVVQPGRPRDEGPYRPPRRDPSFRPGAERVDPDEDRRGDTDRPKHPRGPRP